VRSVRHVGPIALWSSSSHRPPSTAIERAAASEASTVFRASSAASSEGVGVSIVSTFPSSSSVEPTIEDRPVVEVIAELRSIEAYAGSVLKLLALWKGRESMEEMETLGASKGVMRMATTTGIETGRRY